MDHLSRRVCSVHIANIFRSPLGWNGREVEAETLPLGPANERRTALPGAVEINRPPGLDVTWLGAALAGRFGREVR